MSDEIVQCDHCGETFQVPYIFFLTHYHEGLNNDFSVVTCVHCKRDGILDLKSG